MRFLLASIFSIPLLCSGCGQITEPNKEIVKPGAAAHGPTKDGSLDATGKATMLACALADVADITAGKCIPVTISRRVEKGAGFEANDPFVLSVSVSSSSATGMFFSDAACASETKEAVIESGDYKAFVYFKDSKSGRNSITVARGDLISGSCIAEVKEAGESGADSGEVTLVGTWTTGCIPGQVKSDTETLSLKADKTYLLTREEYTGSGCATLGTIYEQSGVWALGAGKGDPASPRFIDFEPTDSKATVKALQNVLTFNATSACGYNDWIPNIPKSTHNLSTLNAAACTMYATNGSKFFNIFAANGAKMQLGSVFVWSPGVTVFQATSRPTSLSTQEWRKVP